MKKTTTLFMLFVAMACDESLTPPEISVDISPVYVGTYVARPDAGTIDFDLQLINRGEGVLTLETTVEKGDQNCDFEFMGPDQIELGHNESSFIRGWYYPRVVGEEHISLSVQSNSSVYPQLVIPICARGVPPGTQDAGPPPECHVPPDNQPDCPTE